MLHGVTCWFCARTQELQRHLRREFSKLVALLQAYALISTRVRITCSNQVGTMVGIADFVSSSTLCTRRCSFHQQTRLI